MNNKQAIYGTIFFLMFLGAGALVYQAFLKPAGSCTDGILNQGEEKADCGGPCMPCDIVELSSLRMTREPKVLSGTGGNVTLFEILNPNGEYDAQRVPYTLTVYESGGRMIEEVKGEMSVPSLRRTLVLERGVKTFSESIAKIELSLGEPQWEKSFTSLSPSLSVSSGPMTFATNTLIRVSGKVKNDGTFDATNVKLIAVVADQYGRELYASHAVLSSIPAFSERDFSVAFPADANLARLIDSSKTRVVLQAY